jgi:hypothetical protein
MKEIESILDTGCRMLDEKPTMFFSVSSIEYPASSIGTAFFERKQKRNKPTYLLKE